MEQIVTTKALENHLGVNNVLGFFHRRKEIIKRYITIKTGKLNKYVLTDEGMKIVELIYHFRDYYRNLWVLNETRFYI